MSRKIWEGLLASALVGVVVVALDGCGGDNTGGSNTVTDASSDGSRPTHRDASPDHFVSGGGDDAGPDVGVVAAFDGTSGKLCSSNADCGSTGVNVCSNTYSGKLNSLNGVTSPQFWPSPICMVPLPTMAGAGNCDPGPANTQSFCDSADPTDPTSHGICLPLTVPQEAGPMNGFCLPHCSFALDGSPAVGCAGKNTCTPSAFLQDPTTGAIEGHGYCQGTCQADSDCSGLGTGWVCQTDLGVCTKTKKVRTKTIGTSCSNSGMGATPVPTSDSETGACNCPFSGSTTTAFYCTSACVTGGNPCPTGFVCDALIPVTYTGAALDGGDIVLPASIMQSPGLAGQCFATCAADAGAPEAGAGDAGASGGQCPGASNLPPLSTCSAPGDTLGTLAGPDCLP